MGVPQPQPWWLVGLAAPAVLVKTVVNKRRAAKPKEDRNVFREREEGAASLGSEPEFVCEKVCTTDKLLRRLGGLAKDPTPNTCVTVCSVGVEDACSQACQRAVCTNIHQVPAWNEACLRRCTQECARGRSV